MAEATSIDTLSIEVTASATPAAVALEALATALGKVKANLPGALSGLAAFNRELKKTTSGITGMSSKLANSNSSFSNLKNGATSSVSALNNTGFGMKTLSAQTDKVANSFKTTTSSIGKASTGFATTAVSANTTASGIGKLSGGLTSLSTKLKGVADQKSGILNLGSSFIELRSAVFTTMLLVSTVGVGAWKMISAAMADVEDKTRFGQIFAQNAQEANAWADTLANTLGIDATALKDTYSTFYSMATSMGMVASSADTVSKGFTQLTYDIASFKDESFDEVFTRIRSALSGETEAIDAYGYSIKQTMLQQELENEGFSQKVNALNAADKAILIYNALMKQSVTAQGDLARTLSSPANMLRVLKDQATIAARSFGYLFIPAISAVLPWLIYLTQALSRAAVALGALFGISVPSWSDYMASLSNTTSSFTDGTADAADNLSDAAGSAADTAASLNEAKNNTLGIDELNVMSQDTTTGGSTGDGGGSGSGGGAGAGIGIKPVDVYDMIGGFSGLNSLLTGVKASVANLSTTFAPLIDAGKRLWNVFQPFAALVFKGFTDFWNNVLIPLGVWTMNTIGVAALDALTHVLQWFVDHPEAAEALGAILAILTALKALDMGLGLISWIGKLGSGIFGLKNIGSVVGGIAGFVGKLLSIGEFAEAGATGISILEYVMPGLAGVVEGATTAIGALTGGITIAGVALGWWVLLIIAVIAAVVLLIMNWDSVVAAVQKAVQAVSDFFAYLGSILAYIFSPLKSTFDAIGKLMRDGFDAVCAVWAPFAQFFRDLHETIQAIFKASWDVIYTVVSIVAAMIGTLFINLADFLGPIIQSIGDFFTTTFGPINQWISDNVITPVINAFDWMVNNVLKPLFEGIANFITDIFRGVVNGIIWFINGIIDAVNFVLGAAKSVDKTGMLSGVDYVSKIDYMAQGGLPSAGSLFVAGEAGPEIYGSFGGNNNTVMPLKDSGFVQAMGKAVYEATIAAQSNQQSSKAVTGDVYLDSTKVGKILSRSDRLSGAGLSLVNQRG